MITKCQFCKKKIEFRMKECDATGLAWHSNCFCCCVCKVPLNEKDVRIRGESPPKLYCESHAVFVEGFQPICKIYFFEATYRVVF